MEMAVELEDDLFFADLSKQISLLILDDDDKDEPFVSYPSVSFQSFTGSNHPLAQHPFLQEQMIRREIKGTGVFIPKSAHQPRRKHRQGRHSSSLCSKPNGQLHDNTSMASQASFNNIFYPRKA